MSTICMRCDGTGFLNTHQMPENIVEAGLEAIRAWMLNNDAHDVCVCDCCGDGESWTVEEPGYHGYNDPRPYSCM